MERAKGRGKVATSRSTIIFYFLGGRDSIMAVHMWG